MNFFNSFILRFKVFLCNFKPFRALRLITHYNSYVASKKEETYFPNVPQKSNLNILWDQIKFILRYGCIEEHYYHYGHDRIGAKIREYMFGPANEKILSESNSYPFGKDVTWEKQFNYKALVRDKYLFALMMDEYGLPIPKTYGFVINSQFFVQQEKKFKKLDDICNFDMDVMVKPTTGNGGIGMFHITVSDGIISYKNKSISIEELKKMLRSNEMYILQEFVTSQHPDMASLFPKSLNTLRVTMVRDDMGEIHLLGVMALMGMGDMIVSNWHYGGIIINVNCDGSLNEYGYSLSLKRINHHPETGVIFKTFKVPFYNEIITICTKAMRLFYGLKSIGWDIAITSDGPIFIEGNDMWGMPAHQMVEERGWKHYYNEFFSYKK